MIFRVPPFCLCGASTLMRSLIAAAALLALVSMTGVAVAELNWPRWRGPEGTGHVSGVKLPVAWSESDILWRAELPGRGQ